jgi:hypothetical protein
MSCDIRGKGVILELPRFAPVIKYVLLFDMLNSLNGRKRYARMLLWNNGRRKEVLKEGVGRF